MGNHSTDSQDDAALMTRLADGDMGAFAELVERHQSSVLSTAYRFLGRWDLAEDVAQETFIRVYRAASSYVPSAAFTTWLYRIAVNLCQDALRRRRPALEPPADLSDGRSVRPGENLEQAEQTRSVRDAVMRLPERQRIAVVLHRYAGMTHAEVADVTGWTASAVESCLVRAYARLREDLVDLRDS